MCCKGPSSLKAHCTVTLSPGYHVHHVHCVHSKHALTLVCTSTLAPCSSRVLTTLSLPFWLAQWRAVAPFCRTRSEREVSDHHKLSILRLLIYPNLYSKTGALLIFQWRVGVHIHVHTLYHFNTYILFQVANVHLITNLGSCN